MKKLITMLLALTVLFSLVACAAEEPNDSASSSGTQPTEPEHSHEYTEKVTAPTCTEQGYTTYICSCGDTYKDKETAARGHNWSDWTVTQTGNCTHDEISKRNCSACGQAEERATAATGAHSYNDEGVCAGCGKKVSVGLRYQLSQSGEYYTLIAIGSCEDTEIVIPEVYEGLPVTAISGGAFMNRYKITSIVIPDSVTRIGNSAFSGCTGLTSITLPDSVTEIERFTFKGCTGLTSITLPDSVTSIGEHAFDGCTSLTSVIIPSSLRSTERNAFGGCENLHDVYYNGTLAQWMEFTSKMWIGDMSPCQNGANLYINGDKISDVVLPDTMSEITSCAFYGVISLNSITIPNSVSTIGDSAFGGCTGLTSITIPESVYYLGIGAFSNCTRLTSVTIPDSITRLLNTFYGCTGLTSITIPDSVTYISGKTFKGCTGLTSITLPDSVTEILPYMFEGCTGLTSITIPDSVTNIGEYAFDGCISLTEIHYNGTKEQWNAVEKVENYYTWDEKTGNYTIYCTDGEIKKGQ